MYKEIINLGSMSFSHKTKLAKSAMSKSHKN